jgi:hypothetical protein
MKKRNKTAVIFAVDVERTTNKTVVVIVDSVCLFTIKVLVFFLSFAPYL